MLRWSSSNGMASMRLSVGTIMPLTRGWSKSHLMLLMHMYKLRKLIHSHRERQHYGSIGEIVPQRMVWQFPRKCRGKSDARHHPLLRWNVHSLIAADRLSSRF